MEVFIKSDEALVAIREVNFDCSYILLYHEFIPGFFILYFKVKQLVHDIHFLIGRLIVVFNLSFYIVQ